MTIVSARSTVTTRKKEIKNEKKSLLHFLSGGGSCSNHSWTFTDCNSDLKCAHWHHDPIYTGPLHLGQTRERAHSKGSFRIRGRQFYLCVYENEEEDARDENEKWGGCCRNWRRRNLKERRGKCGCVKSSACSFGRLLWILETYLDLGLQRSAK